MVWDDSVQAGFTTGTPWLPIKPPQKARNVASQGAGSVLESYRETLTFRKNTPALRDGTTTFLDLPDPILGFLRDDLMCLYNLSPNSATLTLNTPPSLIGPSQNAEIEENTLTLGANGFAFLTTA
jgi:alpha-glucosidase